MKATVTHMNRNISVFWALSVAIHVAALLWIQSPAPDLPSAVPTQKNPTLQLSFIKPSPKVLPATDTKQQRNTVFTTPGSAAHKPLLSNNSSSKNQAQTTSYKDSVASVKQHPIVRTAKPRLHISSEFVKFLTHSERSQTTKLAQATHSLLNKQIRLDYQQSQDQQSQENARIVTQRLTIAFSEHFNYPRLAQRNGWQGIVKLGLRIEPNGQLSRIRVVSTSGFPVLDKAALDTLNRIAILQDVKRWLNGAHFDTVLPVEYKLLDG